MSTHGRGAQLSEEVLSLAMPARKIVHLPGGDILDEGEAERRPTERTEEEQAGGQGTGGQEVTDCVRE